MKNLKDKLGKLQKKSIDEIDTSSLLDITSQKQETNDIFIDEENKEYSADEDGFIIPSSVADVIQQKIQQTSQEIQQIKQEVDENFSIKSVGKSLSSLKNIVLASITSEDKDKDKSTETEETPKKSKKKFKDAIVEVSDEIKKDAEEIVEEVKKEYKKKTKKDIPDEVDIVETVTEIEDALESIPNTEDLELSDFEIINTKSKKGYTKTVVGFKKDTPKEMSEIATIARKVSSNLIKPRTMDLMNIANVNKTQLKDKQFKLSVRSYVFKPDHTKLKVSKFNRFIISLHEDFESTKQVYIYLQESRKKYVTKLDIDVDFLGKLIYSFYNEGFDVTQRRLQFKNTQTPLLRLVTYIVKSKEFKVKHFKVDEESQTIKGLKIKSTGPVNEWLTVIIKESSIVGLYDIFATADFDESWKIKINSGFKKTTTGLDLAYFHTDDFIQKLVKFWNNKTEKWKTAGLDLEEKDTKEYMLLHKLKHRNLRKAYLEMIDIQESATEIGLDISATYSQLETKKLLDLGKQDDYNAELIVGKTNYLEYFMISYFANLIVGGDKRKASEFITSKEYYEKYGVKDKRDYSERRNTILKRGEEKERNYNARPYQFKLEYKTKSGKEKSLISNTFDELKEKTQFLTDSPK